MSATAKYALGPVLDIQTFADNGTWRKPEGAAWVEAVIRSGDGGAGRDGSPGQAGREMTVRSPAADLPDSVPVTVGKAGLGVFAADGYVIVTTYGAA